MENLARYPRRLLLFALLSVADLALTCWLLGRSIGEVGEGNPVARWWLAKLGWPGLAGFKAGMAALTLSLLAAVSEHRPRLGGRVLGFACLVLVGVVGYSLTLCPRALRSAEERFAQELEQASEEASERREYLAAEARRETRHRALVHALVDDLLSGRYSLLEVTERLAESERGRDPAWRGALALQNPGRSDEQCLAISLLQNAVAALADDADGAGRVAAALEQEFDRTFRGAAPLPPITLPARSRARLH